MSPRAHTRSVLTAAIGMGVLISGGCSKQLGAFIALGERLVPQKIEAEYKLPPGPVMVLVDDDQGLIQPPTARYALVDAMARELKAHNIADRVTTNEELARLRQAEPKFDQRGARELGRMAEVNTVLMLSTQGFALEDELELASSPAKFAVTVRVINARAEDAKSVRLWPPETTEREGRPVDATLTSHEVRRIKTAQEAHEQLAEVLAKKITEMFYDRTVDRG